jgi:hypothetical protein
VITTASASSQALMSYDAPCVGTGVSRTSSVGGVSVVLHRGQRCVPVANGEPVQPRLTISGHTTSLSAAASEALASPPHWSQISTAVRLVRGTAVIVCSPSGRTGQMSVADRLC